MKLYGIPNCDTVRKARRWLSDHGIQAIFHDFRKDGVDENQLRAWITQVGWEALVNRRGATWRQLPDAVKHQVNNAQAAIALMRENPSVIKRPVLEANGVLQIGFDEPAYHALLKQA